MKQRKLFVKQVKRIRKRDRSMIYHDIKFHMAKISKKNFYMAQKSISLSHIDSHHCICRNSGGYEIDLDEHTDIQHTHSIEA
jgi:hypothetical protein